MSYTLFDGREYMQVDDAGRISRPAIKMQASDNWRVLGAARFNNFGAKIEYIPFPECAGIKDWQHKNGKQKWQIVDFDHGTKRCWFSPRGVRLWKNKES